MTDERANDLLHAIGRHVRSRAVSFESIAAQCEHQGAAHRETARLVRALADEIEAGRLVQIEAALRLFDGISTAVVIEPPPSLQAPINLAAHIRKLLRWSAEG